MPGSMKTKFFLSLCSLCILLLSPEVIRAQPVSLGTQCSFCGKERSHCTYKGRHPKCPTCHKCCGSRENACPYDGSHPTSSKSATGTHVGHEWVDLGLSVKWATCNVGASEPTGYGNYYAWGEIRTKGEYTYSNCYTYERTMFELIGDADYDAARANWGGGWRLPTKDECDELTEHCTCQWTTQDGVAGMRFTSPTNGNSIFIPAAGYRIGTSAYYVGTCGNLCTATPYPWNTQLACILCFGAKIGASTDWDVRYSGRPARPVLE